MFIIKAITHTGTTDVFEAEFISIPPKRDAVYLEQPNDIAPRELPLSNAGYKHVYIENNIGRTIEAVHSQKD